MRIFYGQNMFIVLEDHICFPLVDKLAQFRLLGSSDDNHVHCHLNENQLWIVC